MGEEDLEQLYARLEKPLCNLVYRWLWSMDESQGVVQDAFVRLWRMRARVDKQTVEPLIYKIALNLAASRRRSKRVWRWVSFDTIRVPSSADEPADDAISSRQELGRLRRAVERLPDDLRRVIMLCEYSELSYDEIAGIMQYRPGPWARGAIARFSGCGRRFPRRRHDMTESHDLFAILEPPPDGPARLRSRMDREKRRSARRRRLRSAAVVGVLGGVLIIGGIALGPGVATDPLPAEFDLVRMALGQIAPPIEPVTLPDVARVSTAVLRVPLPTDEVVFYLIGSIQD